MSSNIKLSKKVGGGIASPHGVSYSIRMKDSRNILIVDDDPDSIRILKPFLEAAGYAVDWASSGEEALAEIKSGMPHLILLDVNMPGISGFETLNFIRQKKEEYVAIIFVSAKTNTEDVIHGLDAGADDYIRKPFDVREVLSRVRAKLRIKDLNDQLKDANSRLASLVDIDDLTGLYNMRSVYDKLDREIIRSLRFGRPMAVIMMDMDHFKTVNDKHNHLFGSFVLSEVGKIIRTNIRKVDFGARYGGDEFLICLTETTAEGAKLFCERLRQTIESYEFQNGTDYQKLTSSIGVAVLDPLVPIDARTIAKRADECLYDSKEKGRNQVNLYDFANERDPSKVVMPQFLRDVKKSS